MCSQPCHKCQRFLESLYQSAWDLLLSLKSGIRKWDDFVLCLSALTAFPPPLKVSHASDTSHLLSSVFAKDLVSIQMNDLQSYLCKLGSQIFLAVGDEVAIPKEASMKS